MAEPIQIVTYFLLISLTSKGRNQLPADVENEIDKITVQIRNYGAQAQCLLFKVPGPYDFISKVDGVSEAQAIQIQQQIELDGNVKAFLLPGVRASNKK